MEQGSRIQQEIIKSIRYGDGEVDALRSQVQRLTQQLESKQYRGIHPVTLGLAAAFLIIIGLSATMVYLSDRQPRAEMLFEQYFEPYAMNMTTRGAHEPTDFERALELYAQNDYPGAISAVGAYVEVSPEATYFVVGLCYLQMGLPDLAIKNFDLAEQDAVYFKEPIWWYKALTYVKKNEWPVAEVVLKKLVRNNGPYKQGAAELLGKIGSR
ncbi:MAG: hypothetical protein ACWA6U_05845 [Breznakibacter sp.]